MKRLFLTVVIAGSMLQAGSIESWSNGLINSASETPGYFKSQTRGYYTLGSQTIRINGQGTFTLAHLELPRLSVGCGGIDATWGGFSYLSDPKYLVSKLKAIGLAAAAYVFKMAISTLSKDASETLDALDQVSNAINNFNLDSCSIGKSVADSAVNFFTEARQQNISSGQTNNPIQEKEKGADEVMAGYVNRAAEWIKGLGGTPADAKSLVDKQAGLGSFLARAIRDNDRTGVYAQQIFGYDTSTGEGKMLGVIRYLIGDIVGYWSGTGKYRSLKYEIIKPGVVEIDKTLDSIINGNQIPYKTLKLDSQNRYVVRATSKQFSFTGGLIGLYKLKLNAIVNKMKSYQAVDANDRKFIQMQPIPIYKALNVVAVQNNQALLDEVAEQLALRQAAVVLNHILWVAATDLSAELQSASPDQDGIVKPSIEYKRQVISNIGRINDTLQKTIESRMKESERKVALMYKIRDIERQIKSHAGSELLNMMDF